MENEPKTNADNENLRDISNGDGDSMGKQEFHRKDNSGSEGLNTDRPARGTDDNEDTDKYLAMEQPGVTYTEDSEPANLSDNLDYSGSDARDTWEAGGESGTNSDAFNQDDYILTDNVDLDEDQNQSISTDDEDFEETNERYTS